MENVIFYLVLFEGNKHKAIKKDSEKKAVSTAQAQTVLKQCNTIIVKAIAKVSVHENKLSTYMTPLFNHAEQDWFNDIVNEQKAKRGQQKLKF